MKRRIPITALAIACAAALSATAQTRIDTPSAYSLGTSTQGGFPSPPPRVEFGPLPDTPAVPYDQMLAASITAALASDPTLRGADVTIVVSGGNVAISGSAMNEAQAAYAKGVAVGIAGAGHVEGVVAAQ